MKGKRGRRVRTLDQLHALAMSGRAVLCPGFYCFEKYKPAAFILNLNGVVLRRLMQRGLYVYKPQKPRRRKAEVAA